MDECAKYSLAHRAVAKIARAAHASGQLTHRYPGPTRTSQARLKSAPTASLSSHRATAKAARALSFAQSECWRPIGRRGFWLESAARMGRSCA